MASDHSTLLRNLRKQGFHIEYTRRHLKIRRSPNGRFVVIPASPSGGRRGMLNSICELKRIGYQP